MEELRQACSDGNVQEVQELLQNEQININWQDFEYSRTPFYISCQKGHIEIVKLLLNDNRVDINKADSRIYNSKWMGSECKYKR